MKHAQIVLEALFKKKTCHSFHLNITCERQTSKGQVALAVLCGAAVTCEIL